MAGILIKRRCQPHEDGQRKETHAGLLFSFLLFLLNFHLHVIKKMKEEKKKEKATDRHKVTLDRHA